MTSPFPTNAGASMDASGITVEIKALAMSGQENFVPAAEEASQASHSFLLLAPSTSTGYPVAPLFKLPGVMTPRQWVDQTRGALELEGEKGVGDGEDGRAKSLGAVDQGLAKVSRSESMSSEASNSTTSSSVGTQKGMSSMRFLKLGPVHFDEGDWSEEVVE
ncbi:hypothetical protein SBOR_4652 [Sclerotinia borealis F-4128]|uniref:Uncharacterized protein n=1 Tax=Sclerotinia borealis (strain F-4128) TaxID=1432307 RepID=W9CJX8_SCLBF|nr:hypothetical protein SBOR_4652 [Sclerotinia borealis F-4128]